MSGDSSHWDRAYRTREEEALSWFQTMPERSLALIEACVTPMDTVIDVGAGASRLVDGLLARGFTQVAALDLSGVALAISMVRLGTDAERVDWFVADVTRWTPPRRYLFWHDRAVFHFLTDPVDRAAYVGAMLESIAPGGYAAISCFADDGPEICSGQQVKRYTPEEMASELERWAPGVFQHVKSERHVHQTPQGNEQRFQTSLFRRQM